jgi:hypothetical protein
LHRQELSQYRRYRGTIHGSAKFLRPPGHRHSVSTLAAAVFGELFGTGGTRWSWQQSEELQIWRAHRKFAYWPLEKIDQKVRPRAWARSLCNPVTPRIRILEEHEELLGIDFED